MLADSASISTPHPPAIYPRKTFGQNSQETEAACPLLSPRSHVSSWAAVGLGHSLWQPKKDAKKKANKNHIFWLAAAAAVIFLSLFLAFSQLAALTSRIIKCAHTFEVENYEV